MGICCVFRGVRGESTLEEADEINCANMDDAVEEGNLKGSAKGNDDACPDGMTRSLLLCAFGSCC